MTDTFDRPLSGMTNVTEVVSAAAQTQILARINLIKALIPDPTAGTSAPTGDHDAIKPHMATALRTELDALIAAVDAAPTA